MTHLYTNGVVAVWLSRHTWHVLIVSYEESVLRRTLFWFILFDMTLFDGRLHSQKLEDEIKNYLNSKPYKKELEIIQIGSDPASTIFVNLKKNLCTKLGIKADVINLSEHLGDNEISSIVQDTFGKTTVGGGIIQLPLPRASLKSVLNLIPFEKDIDLLSDKSLNQYYGGDFTRLSPVVRSLKYYLDVSNISLNGISAVVIGNGFLVGKPVSYFLSKHGAKVTTLENYLTGQKLECQLLISSTGICNLINGEDISIGCHIVDFGSSRLENKTVGDFNLNSKTDHLGIVSPSPGGMGPLVVKFLIMNLLGLS